MDEFIEPKAKIETEFFLATVAEVDDEDGISIIPEGQTSATGKKYKMLINGGFTPEAGDRVVVLKQSGTFVILGKLGYPEDNTGGGGGDEYVKKTGDTMTGNLSVEKTEPSVLLKSSAFDNQIGQDVPQSGYEYASNQVQYDGDGQITGYDWIYKDSADAIRRMIGERRRTENGGTINNYFILGIDASGVRFVELPTSGDVAWRKALGIGTNGTLPITIAQGGTEATTAAAARENLGAASTADLSSKVSKAGDTMTGDLTIEKEVPTVVAKSTTMDPSTTINSNVVGSRYVLRDKNGDNNGYFQSIQFSGANRTVGFQAGTTRVVNGSSMSNLIGLYITAAGTRQVILSETAPWWTALGLNETTTTTASQIVTAAANWSITEASFTQWGKVAQVFIKAKTTAQVTTTTTTTIMTIVTGKTPVRPAPLRVWLSTSYQAVINTNGTVYMSGATIAANTEFTFIGTYLLP